MAGDVWEKGLAWGTLRKILAHSAPPGYRQKKERPKRKLGEKWEWMGQVLPRTISARHGASHGEKLRDRLKTEHGFKGGYTVVKEAVRES